jgi:ABC-type multidrug transport system ATPase subunit
MWSAEMRGIPPAERRRGVRQSIDVCGLGPALTKSIGQLSKGMKQRVGLADAMLHNPDLLILDGEPLESATRVRFVISAGEVVISPEDR